MDSGKILEDVKKLLGLAPEYGHFDKDITIFINSAIATLTQIGVGPDDGYRINSDSTWGDYIEDMTLWEDVKSYIYLRVRLVFDPPTNAFLVTAFRQEVDELIWRLDVKRGE